MKGKPNEISDNLRTTDLPNLIPSSSRLKCLKTSLNKSIARANKTGSKRVNTPNNHVLVVNKGQEGDAPNLVQIRIRCESINTRVYDNN